MALRYNEPDILSRHPDLDVRVWNAKLSEVSVASICNYEDLTRTRVREILSAPPPEIIATDARYVTGMIAAWVAQAGDGPLKGKGGETAPFIGVIRPIGLTGRLWERGLREILRSVRESHPRFSFSQAAEQLPLPVLLKVSLDRGYPCWELGEDGSATPYSGRFDHVVVEAEPEEQESPSP